MHVAEGYYPSYMHVLLYTAPPEHTDRFYANNMSNYTLAGPRTVITNVATDSTSDMHSNLTYRSYILHQYKGY